MCPLHAEDARKIPAKETIFPGRIETPLLLVTLLPFLSPPPHLLPLFSFSVISQPPSTTVPTLAQRHSKSLCRRERESSILQKKSEPWGQKDEERFSLWKSSHRRGWLWQVQVQPLEVTSCTSSQP